MNFLVYTDGKICMDILDNKWTPMYDIVGILSSIQLLLQEPNASSPANAVAAKLLTDNYQEYKNQVNKCVEDSWVISEQFDSSQYTDQIILN